MEINQAECPQIFDNFFLRLVALALVPRDLNGGLVMPWGENGTTVQRGTLVSRALLTVWDRRRSIISEWDAFVARKSAVLPS